MTTLNLSPQFHGRVDDHGGSGSGVRGQLEADVVLPTDTVQLKEGNVMKDLTCKCGWLQERVFVV